MLMKAGAIAFLQRIKRNLVASVASVAFTTNATNLTVASVACVFRQATRQQNTY